MSEAAETIKIKYKDLAAGSNFFRAFSRIASCTFGGRQDQALVGLSRRIVRAQEEFTSLNNKAFKERGKPDRKTGGHTVAHLDDTEYQKFEELLEGYAELEADLKITAPLKLKKRKSHTFSALEAALVADVIEVDYDTSDEGEQLDKVG